jgi:hypothetical protein
MIQVSVKGDLLYGREKCAAGFVNTGRSIVPNEPAKTRNNDTIMTE